MRVNLNAFDVGTLIGEYRRRRPERIKALAQLTDFQQAREALEWLTEQIREEARVRVMLRQMARESETGEMTITKH